MTTTNQLQEQYKCYAFIDQAKPEDVADAKAEAIVIWHPINGPIRSLMDGRINRTYENSKWYYLTFKPYNRAYENKLAWFTFKGLDYCRKYFIFRSAYCNILTREIEANKVHINALCCLPNDQILCQQNADYNNKYKIYISELDNIGDRKRVLNYIVKEMANRAYQKYVDYYIGPKE